MLCLPTRHCVATWLCKMCLTRPAQPAGQGNSLCGLQIVTSSLEHPHMAVLFLSTTKSMVLLQAGVVQTRCSPPDDGAWTSVTPSGRWPA